jgi:hypothetical protein
VEVDAGLEETGQAMIMSCEDLLKQDLHTPPMSFNELLNLFCSCSVDPNSVADGAQILLSLDRTERSRFLDMLYPMDGSNSILHIMTRGKIIFEAARLLLSQDRDIFIEEANAYLKKAALSGLSEHSGKVIELYHEDVETFLAAEPTTSAAQFAIIEWRASGKRLLARYDPDQKILRMRFRTGILYIAYKIIIFLNHLVDLQ